MTSCSVISKEIKAQACKDYIARKGNFTSIANEIGVHRESVRRWYLKYINHGESVFDSKKGNVKYSTELKKQIIQFYLEGKYSMTVLGSKYNISPHTISIWLEKYYHGIEGHHSKSKGDIQTMNRKKTTLEERLEIVHWILENKMDCKGAARKFGIGYTTARKWSSDYIKNGSGALVHKKRGKKKMNEIDVSSLNEVERLKLELKREKELHERTQLELEVLKKKEALERKSRYRK